MYEKQYLCSPNKFLMKKALIFLTLCCSLALVSCKKSGVDLYSGDYSFKITGTVTVQRQISLLDPEVPTAYDIELPNDIGQLQIAKLDRDEDSVVVVINHLNGNMLVTHAYCEGEEITLKKFQRDVLTVSIESENIQFPVTISGTGRIYEGKTIIFNLKYKGKAHVGELTYNLNGNGIRMVAYRN